MTDDSMDLFDVIAVVRHHLGSAAELMKAEHLRGRTAEDRMAAALESSAQCAIAMGYLLVMQAEQWAVIEGLARASGTPPAPSV